MPWNRRAHEVPAATPVLAPAVLVAARQCLGPAPTVKHPVKGEVVGVDVPDRKLTVANRAIPGLMPARIMPFVVLESVGVSKCLTRSGGSTYTFSSAQKRAGCSQAL